MARTGDDSWDLASSVGATATMVAAARAMASAADDPLIDDPWAAPLVRAVGLDFFTKMLDGDLDLSQIPNSSSERMRAMIDAMASRTKFFDDHCIDSTAAGIRQVVILASGLDSRAYRLPWPTGTVVYELDQREDWPSALRAAGFDPAAPAAWLAEGLLIYLPPDAQDRLFDQITALSAPGSTLATEFAPGIIDFDADKARELSAPLREHGLDIDMAELVYSGERSHVMPYLTETGWQVTGIPRYDLFVRHGLTPPDVAEDADPLGEIVYVSAVR